MQEEAAVKPKERKHSKLRFTCFNSITKTVPNVVVTYPVNIKKPVKQSKNKNNQPAPRAPLTPLTKAMTELHRKLVQRDVNKIFAEPVTEAIAPGYFNIVSQPMDLSTIKKKIQHDEYPDLNTFHDDVFLMIKNCMTYNPEQSFFYEEAAKLYQFFKRQLKSYKRQLSGAEPQKLSSSLRTFNQHGIIEHKMITSLNIPTKVVSGFKKPARLSIPTEAPPAEAPQLVTFRQLSDRPPTFFRTGNEERLSVFLDSLSRAPPIRRGLSLIKERCGREVLNDAIARLAKLDPDFPLNSQAVDTALLATGGDSKIAAVTEAPIDFYSLSMLAARLPELGLPTTPVSHGQPDNAAATLRLLFFYARTLRHWAGSEFSAARAAILREVEAGITRMFATMPSGTAIGEKDIIVLRHLTLSAKG